MMPSPGGKSDHRRRAEQPNSQKTAVRALTDYMRGTGKKKGRLMLLFDPVVQDQGGNKVLVKTGLEPLLAEYGVRLGDNHVLALGTRSPTQVQAFTNPETVGLALSESVAQGDWRLFFLLRDRVREVKLADVQRVAEQYLLRDNRTLATYLPTERPVRAPAPAAADVAAQLKQFKPQAAVAAVEAFEATPAEIDRRTQHVKVGGVQAALLPKATRGGAGR